MHLSTDRPADPNFSLGASLRTHVLENFVAIVMGLSMILLTLQVPMVLVLGITFSAVGLRSAFWPQYARRSDLLAVLALPVFIESIGWVFVLVRHFTPYTIDAALAKLDMGVGRSLWVFAEAHSWFSEPFRFVYNGLTAAILIALLVAGRRRARLFMAVVLGALLAPPWYLCFPAVGPAHVGDPLAPRNCMPSMHLTWALLLGIHTSGRTRVIFFVFAGLIAIATLTTGEHYLPDLIVAVPWAWTLSRLAKWLQKKYWM